MGRDKMLKVPRMMVYERFMRKAEVNALYEVIPKGLTEIAENYNWENHEKLHKNKTIELHLDSQHKALKYACEMLDMEDYYEGFMGRQKSRPEIERFPDTVTITLDVSYIPLAFLQSTVVLKTIERLSQIQCHHLYVDLVIQSIKEKDHNNIQFVWEIDNYANKWLRTLYHFHMFRMEENNMFILDKDLTLSLLDTNFPIDTSYLKSPNRSFYIYLPKIKNLPFVKKEETKLYNPNVEGLFVNIEDKDKSIVLRIAMYNRPSKSKAKNKLFEHLEHENLYWEIILPHGPSIVNALNKGLEDIKMLQSNALKSDHMECTPSNEDCLNGVCNHHKNNKVADKIFLSLKYIKNMSNLAIQTLLYITAVNRDAVFAKMTEKPIAKNRVRKFIDREETQLNHTYLGFNTVYINGSKNNAVYYNTKDGTKVTRKLKHLVKVKGHWHSFWYKDEAKIAQIPLFMHREEKYDDMGKKMIKCIKWVPPYYRGEGEEVTKEYKLTTGGQKLKKGA